MSYADSEDLVLIAAKLASAVVEDIVSGVWKRVDYLDPMPVVNKLSNIDENIYEKKTEVVSHLAYLIIASSATGCINMEESKSLAVLREYFEKNNYYFTGYNRLGYIFNTALFLMNEHHSNKIVEFIKKDAQDLF